MSTFNDLVEEIYNGLKMLRKTPEEFSRVLKRRLKYFKSQSLYHRKGNVPIKTLEGKPAVEALIMELKQLSRLSRLNRCEGLFSASQQISNLIGSGTVLSDIPTAKIISEFGYWYGSIYMLVDEGSVTGNEVIMSLLMDDGLKEKTNKLALLNPDLNQLGIGSSYSTNTETITVLLLATDFQTKNGYTKITPSTSIIPNYMEIDE